jgi:putative tryptophan/tyrosine transport system substrate-binding protein
MLTRRALVALVGAGVVALAGCATVGQQVQTARVPRVGVLYGGAVEPTAYLEALDRGLREEGYVQGRTIALEVPPGGGTPQPLGERAAALAGTRVDVIVAIGSGAAVAAREATAEIPIVAVGLSGDPVALGLAASVVRPGANVTGLRVYLPELAGKQLQVLTEAAPGIGRVAVVWHPDHPGHAASLRQVEQTAEALGLDLVLVRVGDADDLRPAFEAARTAGADALLPLHDPLTFELRAQIVELAAAYRLPAVYEFREWADAGGLVSYGPSLPDAYRRSAGYVDRILRGARPGDLPIESPSRFDLVLNLGTSRALGLAITPEMLLEATDVIQ